MAIVRVWVRPGTGERLINDEWLVDTETRKVAPAERGHIGVSHSLCLEDFREPGRTAVEAFDDAGHVWLLDLETFRAIPVIAGGESGDFMLVSETCPNHKSIELRYLDVSRESVLLFGVRKIIYCPFLECDYITWSEYSGSMPIRDKLLLTVALRQKVYFKKFAEQFVGDGK